MNESFATISSTGSNAAIIHYNPTKQKSDVIDKNQIYLCDSGGQYYDGTTDVTRTWFFGSSMTNCDLSEVKKAFTAVLKGVISLEQARFPEGTTGFMLDTVARLPLWNLGMDYRHGTGHGVGAYLNVHEGIFGNCEVYFGFCRMCGRCRSS